MDRNKGRIKSLSRAICTGKASLSLFFLFVLYMYIRVKEATRSERNKVRLRKEEYSNNASTLKMYAGWFPLVQLRRS